MGHSGRCLRGAGRSRLQARILAAQARRITLEFGRAEDFDGHGIQVRCVAGVLIQGNQADLGGGLFIAGGAQAANLGTGSAGIYGNNATSEGGGIYMAGTGPQTLLGNVPIVSNTAGTRGGGVALVGGARLQLERFNFEICPHVYQCRSAWSIVAP